MLSFLSLVCGHFGKEKKVVPTSEGIQLRKDVAPSTCEKRTQSTSAAPVLLPHRVDLAQLTENLRELNTAILSVADLKTDVIDAEEDGEEGPVRLPGHRPVASRDPARLRKVLLECVELLRKVWDGVCLPSQVQRRVVRRSSTDSEIIECDLDGRSSVGEERWPACDQEG